MRSNAGMANRQGDVDLREEQVSAPSYNFGLARLVCGRHIALEEVTRQDTCAARETWSIRPVIVL